MCVSVCVTFLAALLLTFTATLKNSSAGLYICIVLKALTNLATKTGTHSFSTS